MSRIKNIFLLSALLLISACGYHLRGSIDLPEGLKKIYLHGGSSELRSSLKKSLRFSDGELVSRAKEAGVVVKIGKDKMRRRVLSLSSTGRANEYELYYYMDFILLDAAGNQLSKKQTVELSRDYFNDQEDVLAKNIEEKIIREEMYRQAVQSIISRSRIALKKSAK
ncbi:MAG: LPS assembly lipoprotein LptE [Methylococcaceae bacterium]